MTVTDRIQWIDTLKGIGILGVVLYHFGATSDYLATFIMPLFFIASGYLFDQSHNKGYYDFLKKKIRTRIVPYVFFLIVTYVVYVLSEGRNLGLGWLPSIYFSYKALLNALLWSTIDRINQIGNPPLWFLPCLFITENYFYFFSKISNLDNFNKLIVILIASAVAAYFADKNLSILLPWGMDIALTAVVFYGFGFLVKVLMLKKKITLPQGTGTYWTVLLMFAVTNIVLWKFTIGQSSMANRLYGNNYWCFLLGAFSGSLAYAMLAVKLTQCDLINYYGKNSLVVFVMNNYLLNVCAIFIGPAIQSAVEVLPVNIISFWNKLTFIISPLLGTIIVLLLSIPFIFLLNKYLPFAMGKKCQRQGEQKPIVST